MKKLITLLLCICVGCLALGSAVAESAFHYGVAWIDGKDSDRVHLRAAGSAASDSLGLYFTGTQAVCLSDPYAEWVYVSIGSEYGYMKSEYLYRGNSASGVTPRQPTAVVNNPSGSWVNLRESPSYQAARVGILNPGDWVTVLGETHDHWYYVYTGDLYGYVKADFLWLYGTDTPSSGAKYGVATIDGKDADRVHLRAKPDAGAASYGLYFTGTQVLCHTDPNAAWTYVSIGSEYGYMKSEYLYRGNNASCVVPQQPSATVRNRTGEWVNLRREPSFRADTDGVLYDGDRVTVLGETHDHWYYVSTAGRYGYIGGDFLALDGAW